MPWIIDNEWLGGDRLPRIAGVSEPMPAIYRPQRANGAASPKRQRIPKPEITVFENL
jgi:hypothetical protein